MLFLQLRPALSGRPGRALEPEQFLRMMEEMTESVERRRAEHGTVGHYNSAHCVTSYQEQCVTEYEELCDAKHQADCTNTIGMDRWLEGIQDVMSTHFR